MTGPGGGDLHERYKNIVEQDMLILFSSPLAKDHNKVSMRLEVRLDKYSFR